MYLSYINTYVYILEGLKEEALVSCFILIRVEKKTNKTRKQNKAWIGDFRLIQNDNREKNQQQHTRSCSEIGQQNEKQDVILTCVSV